MAAEIVHTPGVLGGKARISGTRIGVYHVARMFDLYPWSYVGRIHEMYPHLTGAEIQAAREYYENNRNEIERDLFFEGV